MRVVSLDEIHREFPCQIGQKQPLPDDMPAWRQSSGLHLGSAAKSGLLPADRLPERLQHTCDVDRKQHQIERVYAEQIGPIVACLPQITTIKKVVRSCRKRQPQTHQTVIKTIEEENKKTDISNRRRIQVVRTHQRFRNGANEFLCLGYVPY